MRYVTIGRRGREQMANVRQDARRRKVRMRSQKSRRVVEVRRRLRTVTEMMERHQTDDGKTLTHSQQLTALFYAFLHVLHPANN